MNTCDENINGEPDAIDKYLDIVIGRLDGSLTAAGLAKRLNSIYGVEVSLEEAERVRGAAELQFKTGSEVVRRLLTDTRLEMEGHLRTHVAQLRLEGISEADAIDEAFKRFGDPNELHEKVFQSAIKECCNAPGYKFDWRSCFRTDTLLNFMSFASTVFLAGYAAGSQLSSSVVMNLWGVVPFVFGFGAGIAYGLSAPMGRYAREVASAIDGKSTVSTLSQRWRSLMIRLMHRPHAMPWVLPVYLLISLSIIVVGGMAVNCVMRTAFWLGCHVMGLCWGRYLQSLNKSFNLSR